ncbi:glycine cleavage system aminomethyltransferase GcvT [Mesorhizobium xinjiangense]|uniref:glycine cleavage system aminomethyltransferase GcvT n=1 Tax=Mesorhizobium xinjiangense TaxID=2678685 RepID=UPI0012EE3A16|nr:glycine cleavage system aminomethyltransferase GcvT [Mesorhizobium xinjiangense]
MTSTDNLHKLPLEDLHREAGAKFGAFAGWSMPITYPLGVMKEHLHVREKAGLFDISHMRLFRVSGTDGARLIAAACPLDPAALDQSQSRYSFLLNDDAGIIDDLIVTRLGGDAFMVVANAGNAAADEAQLRRLAEGLDVAVEPLDRVFIAIQGPEAEAALNRAGIDTTGLVFMHGVEPRAGWFLSRSGYTGEDGFEIALPADEARALAQDLLGQDSVEWIGLAARDSLRLEAGLCLHGQDITADTTPLDAGLMWAIPKPLRETGGFVGADALRRAIANGPARKRVGLKPEGRQPVRAGAPLLDENGETVGSVTSGGFGPSAGHPVAMGYVPADRASPGTQFFTEIRGNRLAIAVHPLPFTPHRYHKG